MSISPKIKHELNVRIASAKVLNDIARDVKDGKTKDELILLYCSHKRNTVICSILRSLIEIIFFDIAQGKEINL